MKTVMMVCSFGMSTSFLTKKMNDIAAEKGIPLKVYAKSENQIEAELDKVDCILIEPQVAYMEDKIRERVAGKVPVGCINSEDFGKMRAAVILKQAIGLLKQS